MHLHSHGFAADPHPTYRAMRERYGPLAPVELAPGVPATLVIDYNTAVRILNDPDHFPADPRAWQKNAPGDCPILPLLEWRPTASRNTGTDFVRYRRAVTESIDQIDLYAIHGRIEQLAVPLINAFCQNGAAELIREYAFPLTFQIMTAVLGCPPDMAQRLSARTASIIEDADTGDGNQLLHGVLRDLVALKRTEPRNDVTSALLRHPAELTEPEIVHNLAQIYSAGIEFLLNLIANTLLLILTEERFGGSVLGGNLSTRDAIDEVLFNDPPLANLLITYPRQPILIEDVWLPAHQPVVISVAACNTDPTIQADDLAGNRAHLAWGLGSHTCPAQPMAYLIAQGAIDQLLDALPDMEANMPSDASMWRPGPFYRALTALPVTFPPSAPLNIPR